MFISTIIMTQQFSEKEKPWPEGVEECEPTGNHEIDQDKFLVNLNEKESDYIRDGDFILTCDKGNKFLLKRHMLPK